ncbi:hypothetical protein H9P43_007289 [Blastocladiella emersonii ATCC 22665]|nr:hypothetical protein H9P43_007289 [Blastocladiella emersonii ATCC 22665]
MNSVDRGLELRLASPAAPVVRQAVGELLSRPEPHGANDVLALVQSPATSPLARTLACNALRAHMVAVLDRAAASTTGTTKSRRPDATAAKSASATIRAVAMQLAHWPESSAAFAAGAQLLVELFVYPGLHLDARENPLLAVLAESPDASGAVWRAIAQWVARTCRSAAATTETTAAASAESLERAVPRLLPVLAHLVLCPNATLGTNNVPAPKRFPVPLSQIADTCLLLLRTPTAAAVHGSVMDALKAWTLALPPIANERDPARDAWLEHLVSSGLDSPEDGSGLDFGVVTELLVSDAVDRKYGALDTTPSVELLLRVLSREDAALTPHRREMLVACLAFVLLDSTLAEPLIHRVLQLLLGIVLDGPMHPAVASMLVIPALQYQAHADLDLRQASRALLDAVEASSPTESHSLASVDAAVGVLAAGILNDAAACNAALASGIPHRVLVFPAAFTADPTAAAQLLDVAADGDNALEPHAHHLFPYALHHLQHSSSGPGALAVIQDLLPRLVASRSPMIVSKVLAVLSAWAKAHQARPAVALAAFVALFRAWKAWNRSYPTLRDAMSYYLSAQGVVRAKRGSAIDQAHRDLELGLAVLLRDALRDESLTFGQVDDAALFLTRFIQLPSLAPATLEILIDGCTLGAARGMFEADGMWNLTLAPVAVRALGLPRVTRAMLPIYRALAAYLPHLDAEHLRSTVVEALVYPFIPFAPVVDHCDTRMRDDGSEEDMPVYKPKVSGVAPDLVAAALDALVALPVAEIQRWIPDKVPETCQILLAGIQQPEHAALARAHAGVLRRLLEHEADEIPRSLFLGRPGTESAASAAGSELDLTRSSASTSIEADISAARAKLVVLGIKSPAILSAASRVAVLPVATELGSFVGASLADGTFDHHLMHRLMAVPMYQRHYATHLPSLPTAVLGATAPPHAALLAALVRGFTAADMVNVKANAMFAMSGLALALHAMHHEDAPAVAEFVFSFLVQRFLVVPDGVEPVVVAVPSDVARFALEPADAEALFTRDTADVSVDELQAAAAHCLGHLSNVAGAEHVVAALVEHLIKLVDEETNWSGFSAAFSLCMVLGHKFASRTDIPAHLARVQSYLEAHATRKLAFLPIKKAVGLAMGVAYASRARADAVPRSVIEYARSAVAGFDADIPLRAACASWILLQTREETDLEAVAKLAGVIDAVADINTRGHLMATSAAATAQLDAGATAPLVAHHLAGWLKPGTAPAYRINHGLALFAALGFDFVDPGASAAHPAARAAGAAVLPKLLDLVGCGPAGTAKFAATNARLAKVCLPFLAWTVSQWSGAGSAAAAAVRSTAVKEPADLARLERDAYVLRNVFDALAPLAKDTPVPAAHVLVGALADVRKPLPLVNWYPVLDAVRAQGFGEVAWRFAAAHAPSSYSALQYLLDGTGRVAKSAGEWALAVSRDHGLGVLMGMAGLRRTPLDVRGRKGAVVTVPEETLAQVVVGLLGDLFGDTAVRGRPRPVLPPNAAVGLQTSLLETIGANVPLTPAADGVHARITGIMTTFLDRHPTLTPPQTRAVVEHFVFSYASAELLTSPALRAAPQAELVHAVVTAAHLVDLARSRPATAPVPRHLAPATMLGWAVHALLDAGVWSGDVVALLRRVLVGLIESATAPEDKKGELAPAEIARANAKARNAARDEWVVRVLDLALLLHATSKDARAVECAVREFLLPLLTRSAAGKGGDWKTQLAFELAAALDADRGGNGNDHSCVNRVLKRFGALAEARPDEYAAATRGVFARFRYHDEAARQWQSWAM